MPRDAKIRKNPRGEKWPDARERGACPRRELSVYVNGRCSPCMKAPAVRPVKRRVHSRLLLPDRRSPSGRGVPIHMRRARSPSRAASNLSAGRPLPQESAPPARFDAPSSYKDLTRVPSPYFGDKYKSSAISLVILSFKKSVWQFQTHAH